MRLGASFRPSTRARRGCDVSTLLPPSVEYLVLRSDAVGRTPAGTHERLTKTRLAGVAAMDRKARSRPMRNILSRLLATGKFEITVFGDKVILDEGASDGIPLCLNLLNP